MVLLVCFPETFQILRVYLLYLAIKTTIIALVLKFIGNHTDINDFSAVIMSPTRELAMQTWKEANKFAKQLDIRVACVYGGVGISDQIGDLKRGAEVVVCTVGRLTDILAANKGFNHFFKTFSP